MKTIPKITLVIVCLILASNNLKAQCIDSVCLRYEAVYHYVNNYDNLKKINSKLSKSELPVNVIPEVCSFGINFYLGNKTEYVDSITLECISRYVFIRNEKSNFFVSFSNYVNNSITVVVSYFYGMNTPELQFVIPSLQDIKRWDIISNIPTAGQKTACAISVLVFTFNKDNTINKVEDITMSS